MNVANVLLIVLVFGAIFWLSGLYVSGGLKTAIQFLAGAIIVVTLLWFLLGLFGAVPRT